MLCSNQRQKLWIAKAMFFCTSMSAVGWSRFQNNFYLDHGMSSLQIGSLKSIGLTLKFFGEPLWCFIADVTDPKAIFLFSNIMQILSMEVLRNIKPLTYNIILFVKIMRTATSCGGTLTTTAVMQLTEGSNEGYGKQRLFGSLAWGIGAAATGYMIDTYGMEALFFYTYTFVSATVLLAMLALPSRKLTKWGNSGDRDKPSINSSPSEDQSPLLSPDDKRHGNGHINTSSSGLASKSLLAVTSHFMVEVKEFLSYPATRALLCNIFGNGLALTASDTSLFISLEKDFKVSRTFSGICTAVSILSCLPMFWYSDLLLARYSHHKLMKVAQICGVIRLVGYSLLSPAWPDAVYLVLAIQTIHGVNFALYWSVTVDAMFKLAPKNLVTSSMSALNVTYFTLAGACGNIGWALIYDYFGGAYAVYITAASILLGFILLFEYDRRWLVFSTTAIETSIPKIPSVDIFV